jgi:alpha-N-arabinofuranosidase
MYNVHQEATWLPVELKNIDYAFQEQKLPAISISASRNDEGVIHISLVNIDYAKGHSVDLGLRGQEFKTIGGTILTSAKAQDHNTFEELNRIAPKEFKAFKISKTNVRVEVPPFSVVVLEIK